MLRLAAFAGTIPLLALGAQYPLIESWKGDGFMDGFNYPAEAYDNTTNGDVFWATPSNKSLIYTTDSGTVVMKVDNTTSVPYNEKRYAPKVLSKTQYEPGTVWVLDAVHLPYGCSVWPAFWTQGPNWPDQGEIDIMEGINMQSTNQVALHADGSDCLASKSTISGTLTSDNCSIAANSASGCTTNITNTNSYGAGFAAAGGGVYVTEFAEDAVKIWFFSRPDVPGDVTESADTIDTSKLGTPSAEYDNSSCDFSKYFGPQTLTIDITLCGDWAGVQALLEETCPPLQGTNTCYTTYVINDAEQTYANAYFEINYVNVYSSSTSGSSSGSGSGSGSGASASKTITAGVTGGASGSGGASTSGSATPMAQWQGVGMGWVGVVVAGIALGLGSVL